MARYQILYWQHIPLGVKATDIHGTVRQNLPDRFQETFQQASAQAAQNGAGAYSTSGFRWGTEHQLEGSALSVATAVSQKIIQTWNADDARQRFERQKSENAIAFLDLKKLNPESSI